MRLGLVFAALAAVASVTGIQVLGGVAAAATPVEACASHTVGSPSDDLTNVVCAELVADLAGIGNLLGLPTLLPTSLPTDPVEVDFSSDPAPDPNTFMETQFFGPSGVPALIEPCKITIFPAIFFGKPPTSSAVLDAFRVLLAHEVVHCYQNSVINYQEAGGADSTAVPQWISEGVATYIATLYKGYAEPATPQFWSNGWLGTPNKELEGRSYDAVGWYSLVAHVTGNDLTREIVPAWRAFVEGGENGFIAALGGNNPEVAMAWGPSIVHMPEWGDIWNTPGIGVPPEAVPKTIFNSIAAQDVPYTVPIAPLGAIVDTESTVSDGLVQMSVDGGFISVHDDDGRDYLDFTDQLFCLKESCPDAEVTCPGHPTPVQPEPLTAPFTVAVGGSATAATFTIENMSMQTTPVPLPKTEGPCGLSVGVLPPRPAFSEGEPHIQTLSGGSYDFQGAGEYTLVRSTSGDVDVQVRDVPAGASKAAAWNTAVAMKIGSSDVEVDVGEPTIVWLDGKRIMLHATTTRRLAGGGTLAYTSNGESGDVVATWPDGSKIDVFADAYAENATFSPPAGAVDTFSGLLAAMVTPRAGAKVTKNGFERLIGGDGKSYVIDPSTPAGFKALYGPFADSWRVTPTTSLFTYPKGKTTSSYDVKGFPATLVTAQTLSPLKRQHAEAVCKAAGVKRPSLLSDCELDVGETGKADLAAATARVQSGTTPQTSTTTTTTTSTTTVTSGSSFGDAPIVPAAVHPVAYYFKHPCEAVTLPEINDALGYPYPEYVSVGGQCPIGDTPDDQIVFSHETVAHFRAQNPGSVGSGPVVALGHEAYCIVRPASALIQSYVVTSLGGVGSLQILTKNCADATALTKDALSHISGI